MEQTYHNITFWKLDDAQSSNHSFTVRSFAATVVGSLIMDKGGTGQVHYCNLKIEKTK